MFPDVRMPSYGTTNVPDDWGIGKTESGWMTGEAFYEYLANCFHKWLLKNKVKLPVITFLVSHKSHLMHLSKFCSDNQITLVALFPNATYLSTM